MNGPNKNAKRPHPFDWMEYGIIVAGFLVFGGLLMESWPELKLAWAERRFPNLTVTGGIIVAVGVLAEVILGIFITQRANRTQSAAKERVARAEQATAEANLARLKIEEQLFKPHVLMGDTLKEFLEIINAYTGRKRVDVFVYDQHIGDVRMLADSINSAFLVAGWNSKMWIGPDPRLVGHEVTFCVPHDERQLQELASRLSSVLHKYGIGSSINTGEISSRLPLGPLDGWGIWDPKDVSVFRVQVGQRQISSDLLTRPIMPPQA